MASVTVCLCVCVCVCPCCKRKTNWAINTKLGTHILHGWTLACIDPEFVDSPESTISPWICHKVCRGGQVWTHYRCVGVSVWVESGGGNERDRAARGDSGHSEGQGDAGDCRRRTERSQRSSASIGQSANMHFCAIGPIRWKHDVIHKTTLPHITMLPTKNRSMVTMRIIFHEVRLCSFQDIQTDRQTYTSNTLHFTPLLWANLLLIPAEWRRRLACACVWVKCSLAAVCARSNTPAVCVSRMQHWRASSHSTRTMWWRCVRCSDHQMACDSSSRLSASSRASNQREFPERRWSIFFAQTGIVV